MLWLAVLGAILVWLDNCLLVASLQRGAGGQGKTRNAYQISPKPCWVDGVEGTCMFVWECIKSEGYHVGMCVDMFMFGSCCAYNSTVNAVVPHSGGGGAGYSGDNKVSVLYTQQQSSSSPSQSKPHWGQRPSGGSGGTTSRPNKYTSRRPQQPVNNNNNYNHLQQSQSTTKNRPSTPPPRHSLRPMSTDHLQQHASNAIIALDASQQGLDEGGGSTGSKPYYGGNSKPQQSIRPGVGNWRPDGGVKTGGSWQTTTTTTTESGSAAKTPSSNIQPISNNLLITKPGVLWQVTTEPGFVTRVKNKPATSHNGQKVKPTKKPVLPVTTAKFTIKYYTKSTTTSTTTTSTTSTTTSTSTRAPPPALPSRRPNPLLSSLMLLTSTLSDNKKPSAASSATATSPSSNSVSVSSTEMTVVSASNSEAVACGLSSLYLQPHSRIVGGKNAAFGRWPWQVSVRRTSFFGFSSTHRCGGAILNENWIATAGHCVDDLLTSQIRIRVGDYDFSSVQEDLPHVERAVARKVVHPKYNFFTYEYDLALVQLDQPLEFAPHISPICLPASDDLLVGENATVTGWGRLSEGGTLPSVLQEVQVPILSNDKCKSMFLQAGRHEFIPDIFLCAGHELGGQDSCQGDSGGPLQVRGRNGRYFLAGIISWGIGCAEANLPGVCTRISKFVPWVLNNVT